LLHLLEEKSIAVVRDLNAASEQSLPSGGAASNPSALETDMGKYEEEAALTDIAGLLGLTSPTLDFSAKVSKFSKVSSLRRIATSSFGNAGQRRRRLMA
jgi:hypothetical protein